MSSFLTLYFILCMWGARRGREREREGGREGEGEREREGEVLECR